MPNPPLPRRRQRPSTCWCPRSAHGRAVALALLALGACAAPPPDRDFVFPGGLPPRVELTEVPFFPQDAYQCGPAALAMALSASGVSLRPAALVSQVYSPEREGSLATDVLGAARRRGRIAYPVATIEDLFAELAAGHPVLVMQDLGFPWYPRWHFAVAIGYDLSGGEIILRSGLISRKVMTLADFDRTWRRSDYWGIVVLGPSILPATVREPRFLEAAVALERAQKWKGAARAYEAARGRWPDSLGALIGLGSAYYALGDLERAEAAFRDAVHARPDAAPAFNNLAHVLGVLGRHEEAKAAAKKALAIGGPHLDAYRATLAAIEDRPRQENSLTERTNGAAGGPAKDDLPRP